ncbi:MAG: 3-oxoacyl-[acyl-carrier-protein] reductase [Chlorobi bacterium]|nr:3-oxoacyl-[acyl-carrier-protein] reductase [Chlorobiota bacterium]
MKYALVTGGSRGIGKAICKQLAEDGFSVIINYRSNDEEANKTLSEIKEKGGNAELLKFDISNIDDIENALEKWADENEGSYIEVLVNNAGIRKDNLQVFMQNDEWNDVINTNLNSFFYVTRRLLKDMLVKKNGRIINIVSLSGLKGMPGQTNYSAAKAGVIGATKSLSQEIARKRVTANCVAPGFIKTDMIEELDEKQFRNIIPMRRFGKPEEVANVVSFLASEKSSYITGEVISVSGGIN